MINLDRLTQRPATFQDAQTLYRWTNNPEVRKFSFQHHPVSWNEHLSWLSKQIQNKRSFLFIVVSDNHPVGQYRFDFLPSSLHEKEKIVSVSISVDAAWRQQGIGSAIITTLMFPTAKNLGISTLISKVKSENVFSYRLFIKTGFSLIKNSVYRKQQYSTLMKQIL